MSVAFKIHSGFVIQKANLRGQWVPIFPRGHCLLEDILRNPCEAHHDDLAVPQGHQYVRVGLGQGQGLDGKLQRHAAQRSPCVEVPQDQVAVLVAGEHPVLGGQEAGHAMAERGGV